MVSRQFVGRRAANRQGAARAALRAACAPQDVADSLEITLLFPPSYSPSLNLIERLWRFIKRRAIYGRYHPTFAEFRAAVEETIQQLPTTHAASLASLMTLNFQRFGNASLMAA